jgi:hypothetical protein
MTDLEVNTIIAEYMGVGLNILNDEAYSIELPCSSCAEYDSSVYTESLDMLVPVWEKLSLLKISPRLALSNSKEKPFYCEIMYSLKDRDDWDGCIDAQGETIHQAAANATAKSIKELS